MGERYRILGYLGRGAMGEVYKAEDRRLGQVVALKFLPSRFAADAEALERFYTEVRLARQVAHPNVCRVYDVAEVDGRLFLSMEYIAGESLDALLRTVGRFPEDRALAIARQLCDGLQAVHDLGVVHRDLKPSNVMIDGRGSAHLTDFGLALPGDAPAMERFAGTLPYAAPELFLGSRASARSDLYALGVLLYELYTGRRPFDADSIEGWRLAHALESPRLPSELIEQIDPVIEVAILRCLEKRPESRPISAHRLGDAIASRDPLRAALALGETPSPQMVASAGVPGMLSQSAGAALLALALGLTAAVVLFRPISEVTAAAALHKPPDALAELAREALRPNDGSRPPGDVAVGFLPAASRFGTGLGGSAVPVSDSSRLRFFYRESPTPMVPSGIERAPRVAGLDFQRRVMPRDPPLDRPGMALVTLGVDGRLLGVTVVPDGATLPSGTSAEPDWDPLLRRAGFEPTRLVPAEPDRTSLFAFDRIRAWRESGTAGTSPAVQAASWRGQPVWFQVGSADEDEPAAASRVSTAIELAVLVGLTTACLILARRHARGRKGDRRGAARLALIAIAFELARQALGSHQGGGPLVLWQSARYWLAVSLYWGALLWVFYMGLEPVVRRHAPVLLVSWSRLLGGAARDPLVGRDALVGVAAGAALVLAEPLQAALLPLFGGPEMLWSYPAAYSALSSPELALAEAFMQVRHSLYSALLGVILFVLLRRALRREAATVFAMALLLLPGWWMLWRNPAAELLAGLLWFAVLYLVLSRYGLLACWVSFVVGYLLSRMPLTFDVRSWFFGRSAVLLAALALLSIWGFLTATRGVPMTSQRTA